MNTVEIANLALSALGADRIMALSEDTTNGRRVNQVWNILRDEVMTEHPWNFAIKRVSLALLGTTPAFGYTYQHQVPSDHLRLLEVFNGTDETNKLKFFKKEGDKILSDYDILYLKYIYRNEGVSEWSTPFGVALAARISAELAYAITNSATLGKTLLVVYQDKIRLAKAYDGQEGGMPDVQDADYWLEERV